MHLPSLNPASWIAELFPKDDRLVDRPIGRLVVLPILEVSIGTNDLLLAPVNGLGRRDRALISRVLAMALLALTPRILFLGAIVRPLEIIAELLETPLSIALGSAVPGPLGTSPDEPRVLLIAVVKESGALLTVTLRTVQVGIMVMEIATVIMEVAAVTPTKSPGDTTASSLYKMYPYLPM